MTTKDYLQFLWDFVNQGSNYLEDLILEDNVDDQTLRTLGYAKEHLDRASLAIMKVVCSSK